MDLQWFQNPMSLDIYIKNVKNSNGEIFLDMCVYNEEYTALQKQQ